MDILSHSVLKGLGPRFHLNCRNGLHMLAGEQEVSGDGQMCVQSDTYRDEGWSSVTVEILMDGTVWGMRLEYML